MNTIPTIFNERKIAHTVVGGMAISGQEASEDFCVIVLNRGRKYYRPYFFEELKNAGFSSIISVELNTEMCDIESLAGKYHSVKFLFTQEKLTVGEMINTAFEETTAPYVLVIWSDVRLPHGSFTDRLLAKVKEENLLCTAPVLSNMRGEALLNQIVPSLNGTIFSTEQLACIKDKTATVYPYDFMGIYNRNKCMQLGGFDYTIQNPYWQNLDFGVRAHLWGEKIRIFTSFRIQYEGNPIAEDISVDSSYRQFYLKNLAPEITQDGAVIPFQVFLFYMRKSGLNPLNAWQHFSAARKWTELNKTRFTMSARTLAEHWEPFI